MIINDSYCSVKGIYREIKEETGLFLMKNKPMGELIMPIDKRTAELTNLAHWNEIAPIHLKSYQIEGLLKGISRIDNIQKNEFYPIKGKDLIHLQCHIGTDTLSLALDGANVTGVDFSGESLSIAKELASKLNLRADFIEANVLDLKKIISKKYDIVYTSKGVLPWISDIKKWAETISHLLKNDGIFYIMETHPSFIIYDDREENELRIKYSYFHQNDPIYFNDDQPDYADSSYIPKNKTYQWVWSISDIINSLINNGLEIVFFNEHDKHFYKSFPGMTEASDGWWFLNKYKGMIPMTFSLMAKKQRF